MFAQQKFQDGPARQRPTRENYFFQLYPLDHYTESSGKHVYVTRPHKKWDVLAMKALL